MARSAGRVHDLLPLFRRGILSRDEHADKRGTPEAEHVTNHNRPGPLRPNHLRPRFYFDTTESIDGRLRVTTRVLYAAR